MKPDLKRLLLLNLPYLFFVYLFGKLGQAYRLAAGAGFSEKVLHCLDGFTAAFASAALSLHPFDLCIGVAGAVLMRLVVYVKGRNAKKYRKGIDRAVQVIYRPYLADPRPENMPILSDLHAALLAQHIPEADRVAQALDLYVTGSLNVFNHRTNVNIQNRIVAYDIKELGKQLKKLGMLIVQDQIWGRVTANRSQGRATWYFCDEFHLLLKEEQTAAFSCEIWKRFRKWGGIPTGATQNVKDLLSSPEIENILENSDFVCLLNQASGDRKILAERLNLSPQQQAYISNSDPGEGLLIYENVILPFTNPIPKDTQLYQIMTTRLEEVTGA